MEHAAHPIKRAPQVDRPGSKKEDDKSKKGGRPPAGPRIVKLEGGREVEGLQGNNVKTAKYNVATFLPIFLFEMFSRIAYLYFLLQARGGPPTPPHLCRAHQCLACMPLGSCACMHASSKTGMTPQPSCVVVHHLR